MKLLCRIFGHKFRFYIIKADPRENIRVCMRCGTAQHYRDLPMAEGWGWMRMVERTQYGASEYFGGKHNAK